jgi:hypothetical protein
VKNLALIAGILAAFGLSACHAPHPPPVPGPIQPPSPPGTSTQK